MRVLFCVPESITSELGKPKVYVELSGALEKAGCQCTVVGKDDVAPDIGRIPKKQQAPYYQKCLKDYINAHAHEFDVIEYEHSHLPYPRSDFASDVILVSRSVLLAHHARDIRWPVWRGLTNIFRNVMRHIAGDFDDSRLVLKDYISVLKKHVGTAVRYELSQKARQDRVRRVNIELRAADLIIVSNQHDVDALVREGISKSNITKLPFGLTDERRNQLVRVAGNSTGTPTITFVGTFDFRKGGATDIPRIVDQVLSEHPEVKMRLLGTRGLFVSEREVLSHFAPRVQSRVEVVPRYDPDTLPELLLGSTLGIFPSRYEGFPFGVLEMLAAGLPVFAYHSPGPPEMLPGEWLSERGDWKGLADSATRLLHDRQTLSRLKQEALSRAQRFKWDQIAEETLAAYTTKLESA